MVAAVDVCERDGDGQTRLRSMIGPLPHDLSRLSTGMRRRASDLRDRRVSMLLRRWPHSLTQAESRELVRLWDERIRLARHAHPASSKRV